MRLQLLRTFVAVSRCRNYALAARELLYSESSVSYHIRELEKDLGVRLFTRTGTELELTAVGCAVADVTTDVLVAVDRLLGVVHAAKAPPRAGAVPLARRASDARAGRPRATS